MKTYKKEYSAKDVARLVVAYIAKNAQRESIFLSPNPAWTVEPYGLLDLLVEELDLDPKEVDRWCAEVKLS